MRRSISLIAGAVAASLAAAYPPTREEMKPYIYPIAAPKRQAVVKRLHKLRKPGPKGAK